MNQYLFEGMFTYYITQRQKGVAQHLLFCGNSSAEDASDLQWRGNTTHKLLLFVLFVGFYSSVICSIHHSFERHPSVQKPQLLSNDQGILVFAF